MPKILEKFTPEKNSFQFRTDVVVIIFVIIVAGKIFGLQSALINPVEVLVLVALLLYKFRQRSEQNGSARQVEIPPENRTIAETSLRAERKDLARLSNDLKTVSHRVLTKLNSIECRSACPSCLKKVRKKLVFSSMSLKRKYLVLTQIYSLTMALILCALSPFANTQFASTASRLSRKRWTAQNVENPTFRLRSNSTKIF